jgi:hypothetical protein
MLQAHPEMPSPTAQRIRTISSACPLAGERSQQLAVFLLAVSPTMSTAALCRNSLLSPSASLPGPRTTTITTSRKGIPGQCLLKPMSREPIR